MKSDMIDLKMREIISRTLPYDVSIDDITIRISSHDVYPPGETARVFYHLAKQSLIDFKNKNVLDLGCGSGIVSVIAAKLGAKSVTALDIVEDCVATTKENAHINHVENIVSAQVSDGFSVLSEGALFDIIVFIAPQDSGLPQSGLDHAFLDESFALLNSVAQNAQRYLVQGGKIILAYMDHNMERRPLEMLFVGANIKKIYKIGEDLNLVEIEPIS